MLRLWFNIFFLHSFCFWLFMKLQQNLFLTFHEASAKKWKKSFYSIFEFLPQYWHLYDMEEPKSESLKPCKLKMAIILKQPWILLPNMKQKFLLSHLAVDCCSDYNSMVCTQFWNFCTIRTFSEPAGFKYWIVRKAFARVERTKIRVFLILTKIQLWGQLKGQRA